MAGMGVASYLMLAASAVSAVGSIRQGKAQKKAAKYNADVAEQDAIAAKNKARYEEGVHRERVKRLLSSQQAITGASGVEMTGSPLLAMLNTAEQGELDALVIRQGGETGARRFKSSAALSKLQGKSAQTGSYYKAGSSLLSGSSKAYNARKQ